MRALFWNSDRDKDWKCVKCDRLNHPDAGFCEFCGQEKKQVSFVREITFAVSRILNNSIKCPNCGADCEKDNLFCCVCGISLKEPEFPTIPVQEIVPEAQRQEEQVCCVHCGTMNDVGDRYCMHCSEEIRVEKQSNYVNEEMLEAVSLLCPECGKHYEDKLTFCNECGAK